MLNLRRRGLTNLQSVLYYGEYLAVGIYKEGGDAMALTREGRRGQEAPNAAFKQCISAAKGK
jgi:hypothetical protein